LNRSTPVVEREHVVANRFRDEHVLQLFELLRILRREVVGLTEIVGDVVKLPAILVERREWNIQPWDRVAGRGDPTVVIDRAVAEHLEILRRAAVFRFGVVERVHH